MTILPPAPNPCGSCPYRRDVPSGVWAADEYDKLPGYDRPTGEQPTGVFLCHRQDGRLCAGWCGTHDMNEALSIRLAAFAGQLDPADVDQVLDYQTPVPLFASGAEAAAHGLADLEQPGQRAVRVIKKLDRP